MSKRTSSDYDLTSEAMDIVEQTQKEGIPLRILGGCAVRIHCPAHMELHQTRMQRKIPDIDLVTLGKSNARAALPIVLNRLGYALNKEMQVGSRRDIYKSDQKGIELDVFVDKIEMCHDVDVRERFEIDYPTISLADLMLAKLQVVKINMKDISDVLVLLLEHELGNTDKETINVEYIARLFSTDWGYYYTVTTNLDKILRLSDQYNSILSAEEFQMIQSKIKSVLARLQNEPKSMKWRMREKVGPKKIWYREVEEQERGSLAEYLAKKQRREEAEQ